MFFKYDVMTIENGFGSVSHTLDDWFSFIMEGEYADIYGILMLSLVPKIRRI